MINKFFGGKVIRTPHSADMYFDREAMCRTLGIKEPALDKRLSKFKYESAKGLRFDGVRGIRAVWCKYGLDVLIGLVFSSSTPEERQRERYARIIDFVTGHINNLCFDGFANLTGWSLPIEQRRAIMAHVCGVDHYLDIPLDRIEVGADYHGSLLRNYHCTPENLAIPEVWITRQESTKIRAIDLAIYLISEHLAVNKSTDELLHSYGIETKMGVYTDDDFSNVVEQITSLMV
jgi:hypothetical protein